MRTDRHVGRRRPLVLAFALLPVALALPAGADAVVLKGGAAVARDNLYGIEAVSPTEAWVVGNFGSIYHTTDGGVSWETRESGTKVPLFGVDFADAQHGWVVGKSALVLHTQDGGRSWRKEKTPIPPDKHLFNLKVVDAKTAWAVGDWGAMTVTHDGGETWEDRSLGTLQVRVEETAARTTNTLTDDVILYDVSFPDPEHGFVAGEFGTLLASADGGRTWGKRDVGTEKTLFGVVFTTPQKGWVVGIDGLILRTRDGGRTWDVQHGATGAGMIEDLGFIETLRNPGLYDIDMAGEYGVVVGDTGNLMVTSDGGETWTLRELPEKERLVWLRGVSLVPGTHGFVVGANGFSAAIERDQLVLPNGQPPKGTSQ